MQEEIWKAVVGYEGLYEVSTMGRVRGLDRVNTRGCPIKGRVLRPRCSGGGYQSVALYNGGRCKTHSVHRLVVAAFIGPIPDGMEVNHIDGCKTNNVLSNLEIVSRAQNQRHAFDMGLQRSRKGEAHHGAVLTERDIPRIFRLRSSGMSLKEIGELFGVCEVTVHRVLVRQLWPHIDVDPELAKRVQTVRSYVRGSQQKASVLTEDDVREIREALARGESQREIARRYAVNRTTIGSIHRRKTWSWLD